MNQFKPLTCNDGAMSSKLFTTAQAARELGVSGGTLARWVRQGRIHPTNTTLGGHHRWDLDDLREQIRQLQQADEQQD